MEELRDIKPLLEIPDYSYAVFIALVSFMAIVLLSLLFILIKKIWINRKEDMKKVYFKQLKEVNWNNAKESAYAVTYLGRKLCHEKRSEEIYRQFLPMLEQYKYKKEVPTVDSETLKQYNLLVHVIDESI